MPRPQSRSTTCFFVFFLLVVALRRIEVTAATNIHKTCRTRADCDSLANTFCKAGECICLPKFSRSYPPCNEGIELGESCSRHENCEVSDNNSYCHHSICRCKPFFHRAIRMEDNATRCVRGPEPRDSCYNAEDCSGSNYTCSAGLCKCRDGFYKDEDSEDCRPRKYLGEACARDSDCESMVNNSYCRGVQCECKSGYITGFVQGGQEICEIDKGGRGALKILFALMLPVVVCAFVCLYRHRKAGQADGNQAPGDEQPPSSPAPQGTYSTEVGLKSPSVNTPLTPMSLGAMDTPSDTSGFGADNRLRPHSSFSIMV